MLDDLTVLVPFWNGHEHLPRLLATLPPALPVIVIDDRSDEPLQAEHIQRPGVQVIQAQARGYFSGAVNVGLEACQTDVLVLNQDLWFSSGAWLAELDKLRRTYAVIGDGVLKHPAWPKGYVQGTFMYMRRDAIEAVGPFNAAEYPLWGSTCEWQLRACRRGFRAHVGHTWRTFYGHAGRHDDGGKPAPGRKLRTGEAISEALSREPGKRALFLRTPPIVSVIMPCYNYGRYIQDAVNSLIGGATSLGEMQGQTLQSFEVIIVDDCSTDDSWRTIQAVTDPWQGIRSVRLPKNRGTPGAINAGISVARGEYVHILSADDMREPWCLETLYRACRANPHKVAYGNVRVFGHGQRKRLLNLPGYSFELVLRKNPMPAGIMYPRQAWLDAGGYPEAMIYGREDWAFNVALGLQGWYGVHVGDSGNLYRREGHNRSLRTGNRHKGEEGQGFHWRRVFQQQLAALFPEAYKAPPGGDEVGCRNCGGGRSAPAARSAQTVAMDARAVTDVAAVTGRELIEYIGGNGGKLPWYTSDGTRYIAGGSKTVIPVLDRHVNEMLDFRIHTRPQFRRYTPPRPKNVPVSLPVVPEVEADIANPSEPDDLTRLRGVGPATAEKLQDAGFTTFLELARSVPEQVAEMAEISLRTASLACQGARAYA